MKKIVQKTKIAWEFGVWLPLVHWIKNLFNKDPKGVILEVRPNINPGYLTVTLGKLDENEQLIPDYRKYICVKVPPELLDKDHTHPHVEKVVKRHPDTRLKF